MKKVLLIGLLLLVGVLGWGQHNRINVAYGETYVTAYLYQYWQYIRDDYNLTMPGYNSWMRVDTSSVPIEIQREADRLDLDFAIMIVPTINNTRYVMDVWQI